MATITDAVDVVQAVRERLDSGVQQFEEKLEQGRRLIAKGRRAAEEGVDDAVLQIRRHPIRFVAAATAIGALVGCVVGFAAGRCARRLK